ETGYSPLPRPRWLRCDSGLTLLSLCEIPGGRCVRLRFSRLYPWTCFTFRCSLVPRIGLRKARFALIPKLRKITHEERLGIARLISDSVVKKYGSDILPELLDFRNFVNQ